MSNEIVGNDTHAQISLQPIAAPSILGLYGLAGATFNENTILLQLLPQGNE